MLTEICQELKNWFVKDEDKQVGSFIISEGKIAPLLNLQENQYYRIIGSVFNDGVHKFDDELIDEEFDGGVWLMRIPKEIINLDEKIEQWLEDNQSVLSSPYQSESFGGYSYSKASGTSTSNSTMPYGWQTQFANELRKWRKI